MVKETESKEEDDSDNCAICGAKIYPLELWNTCFAGGRAHACGCSYMMRGIGVLLKIPIVLISVVIGLIISPFMIFKRVLSGNLCGGW